MAKKILLIENDSAFAAGTAESLEASGFEVRVTGDGKEGLDLAREVAPDAVVLCVELPGMSGYLVCQKLKKDDALKGIPLVLTSAEATEETFEKHRSLKARADEYLLKPYAPAALLEKLGALVGLPEGPAGDEQGGAEEELVSLEEEIGLEASAEGSPDQEVPGLDLESLPDEPPAGAEAAPVEDEDLRLLDDAFDGLSSPTAAHDAAAALDELTGEHPAGDDALDATAASLPEEDEGAAGADLAALDAEAAAALGSLGADDETLSPGLSLAAEPAPRPVRGASVDLLRAAGIQLLDDEQPARAAPADARVPPSPPSPTSPAPFAVAAAAAAAERRERELADARAELERALAEARDALERTRDDLAARETELRDLERKGDDLARRAEDAEADAERSRARAETAAAQARKAEAEIRAGREEARRAADQAKAAEAEASELRRRLGEAERRAEAAEDEARRKANEAAAAAEAVGRAEALEREADELRTELLVARGEAEGARGEVEKRTAELRKRLSEVETANAKNEERVVRAYQKIKADEKVREKVRKALAIATQLLEEGLPAESAADKERRAALAGRE